MPSRLSTVRPGGVAARHEPDHERDRDDDRDVPQVGVAVRSHDRSRYRPPAARPAQAWTAGDTGSAATADSTVAGSGATASPTTGSAANR